MWTLGTRLTRYSDGSDSEHNGYTSSDSEEDSYNEEETQFKLIYPL